MPRGKAIKFPSPEDVARQIEKAVRAEEKAIAERVKQLVQKIAPVMMTWAEGETVKTVPNNLFETEAEQTMIAQKLAEAGWKVDDLGSGIAVHRPVVTKKKQKRKKTDKSAPPSA